MEIPQEARFFLGLGDLLERFKCQFIPSGLGLVCTDLIWPHKSQWTSPVSWTAVHAASANNCARRFKRSFPDNYRRIPEYIFTYELCKILGEHDAYLVGDGMRCDFLTEAVGRCVRVDLQSSSPPVNSKFTNYFLKLSPETCYLACEKLSRLHEGASTLLGASGGS